MVQLLRMALWRNRGEGGLPMAAGTTGEGPSLAMGFRAPPTRCYGGMSDLYVLVEVTPRHHGRHPGWARATVGRVGMEHG
ncbi:unnamed protein product [Arctogadus glacialis]